MAGHEQTVSFTCAFRLTCDQCSLRWKHLADLDMDFRALSQHVREQVCADHPDCCDFLSDAHESRRGGRKVVKGTKDMQMPSDHPPEHKFAAVLDPRPCFDSLRCAFLCGRAQDRPSRAEDIRLLARTIAPPQWRAALEQVANALQGSVTGVLGEPDGFQEIAWPAFIKAIQGENYYFSVTELLCMASMSDSSAIIGRCRDGVFPVEGHVIGTDLSRPIALCHLFDAGGQAAVRSHYERLCPLSMWMDVLSARSRTYAAGLRGPRGSVASQP